MKALFTTCFLVVLLPAWAFAQDDPQWPSMSYLRSDYRSSVVVAHVHAREAEIVSRIGGYEDWRIVSDVVEPFKGKFRKGETLVLYHGAEAGFRREMFLGDKIVFLFRNFVEKEKKWVYAVIENSTLAYNQDRVLKLRKIARSEKRRRRVRVSAENKISAKSPG